MRIFLTICFSFCFCKSFCQTLGGNAAFNFLKLSPTTLLTSAGGINVSYKTNEVGLAANNPALFNADMNSQLNLSFNNFLAGIKTYSLTGAYEDVKLNTSFGAHIYFVDYGSTPQTDAAGNIEGNFHPVDYVVQFSAARQYLERWRYGASVKLIASSYGQYKSTALAVDAGLHYSDTVNNFYAGALFKNMGYQLKTYAGQREDLPFDFELGITKRLTKAPFGFSITAQHLQQFNILYNDTSFNIANDFSSNNHFIFKLLNHFVVATHIYIGNNLEATLGYNHLRRSELNIGSSGNGLNGFSMGLRVKFSKLQVLYARTNYQKNISYNQLGLTMQLNKFFGKDL